MNDKRADNTAHHIQTEQGVWTAQHHRAAGYESEVKSLGSGICSLGSGPWTHLIEHPAHQVGHALLAAEESSHDELLHNAHLHCHTHII